MQLVFDFKTIEQQRPEDKEDCLIIFRGNPKTVYSAVYLSSEDYFDTGESSAYGVYPSSEVLYWAKALF